MASKIDTERFPLMPAGEFVFEGIRFSSMVSREKLKQIPDRPVQSNDIFICSYPKSGTTWLSEIVSYICEGGRSEFTDLDILQRIPVLEFRNSSEDNNLGRRIFRSHLPPSLLPQQAFDREKDAKVITICRDPRDTAVSYFHMLRSVPGMNIYRDDWAKSEYYEMFVTGNCIYGSWFDYVRAWSKLVDNPNIFFISYEQLTSNPKDVIQKLAAFLGKRQTEDQIEYVLRSTTFEAMKKNPACNMKKVDSIDPNMSPFMRKGTVKDWQNNFTVRQAERFQELYKQEAGEFDAFLKQLDINVDSLSKM